MSIEQALKDLILSKYGSISEFSASISMPNSTVNSILRRGVDNSNVANVIAICDALGISTDELAAGRITVKPPAYIHPDEIIIINSFRALDTRGKQLVNAVIEKELSLSKESKKAHHLNNERLVDVIVYNFPAAAGVPLYAEDDSYERLEFPASQVPAGADFGIRISGDSMQPTISAGSIVFVRKVAELRSGDIGIFMLDDEAVCKRFTLDHNRITLTADNPLYPPIPIRDFQRFAITGKVLGYK